MFSYYLTNTDTNEIVVSKWSRIPSPRQLNSIRKAFNWDYDDNLTVSGYKCKFHLIGNTRLIHDGKHFYPSFIEDKTYSYFFIFIFFGGSRANSGWPNDRDCFSNHLISLWTCGSVLLHPNTKDHGSRADGILARC